MGGLTIQALFLCLWLAGLGKMPLGSEMAKCNLISEGVGSASKGASLLTENEMFTE